MAVVAVVAKMMAVGAVAVGTEEEVEAAEATAPTMKIVLPDWRPPS